MKTELVLGMFVGAAALCSSCSDTAQKGNALFQKVPSSRSGIHFTNTLTDTPELNIFTYLYYYNGGGVAAGDFNNDGLTDLYFTSNQEADKLYLNLGSLKFKDITEEAGIDNDENWTTGVTHVDIDHDGRLDLYVCKVGNYKGIEGHNLLFVNQGNDENGIPIFKEESKKYGLDVSGFSTQSAFFDYDLDGDLDLYLLNHSVYPNRTYGRGNKRTAIDSVSGDRLFKNENGKFVDVSAEAHIFQGEIGYGLGLGTSDLNNDGYPDIYVGNDFFENDYLYINQKDGTFKEAISQDENTLGHTTHFSMGNDLADINNDGLTDIISLDMLPENLQTYKTSGLEHPYPNYQNYLRYGYAPQYMQNTLHLNLGNGSFSEMANLAGIPATEWSWSALIADYDNDGRTDFFVSNGIKGATNDMDYINFIANDNIQSRIGNNMTEEDLSLAAEIPEKHVSNYFFRNEGNLGFKNVTETWFHKEPSFSNGAIYDDLDNDGDLDLVVNNVNEEAFVLENTASVNRNHSLKISFRGPEANPYGIGAKVIAYCGDSVMVRENFTTRGYLSAVSPTVHFGLGKDTPIDSLQVVWPGHHYETIKTLKADQALTFRYSDAYGNFLDDFRPQKKSFLKRVDDFLGFYHKDSPSLAFDRDPLVPFANTNEGPDITVADINGDGLDDVFIGGGKGQPDALYHQNSNGNFILVQEDLFSESFLSETVSQVFFDADGDGDQDLMVAYGGNEFISGEPIRPRLYLNHDGRLVEKASAFADTEMNASKVVVADIDNDGDLDVALASDLVSNAFGVTSQQHLFINDGQGNFSDRTAEISPEFQNIGNVKDLVWTDLDENGFQDLIAVGHWMAVSIFSNDGKTLKLQKDNGLAQSKGWWNTIATDDFDGDGDLDLIAGNWGLNSKFKASVENPVQLYRADFDGNGKIEPLVTYFYQGRETPFSSKDELTKQMPFLNKKFLSYKSFAKATLTELFSKEKLEKSYRKKVSELASMFYENDGEGHFSEKPLPSIAQLSTIRDIAVDDFDKDGFKDVLIIGNTNEISTQLGRMDASHGLILLNDRKGGFRWAKHQKFDIPGAARHIKRIKSNGTEYFVVTINNGVPLFLTQTTD